jgi:hypothetical protein
MLRHLSIGLLASAADAFAPLQLKAQEGNAEDLGDVMSIGLNELSSSITKVIQPARYNSIIAGCNYAKSAMLKHQQSLPQYPIKIKI